MLDFSTASWSRLWQPRTGLLAHLGRIRLVEFQAGTPIDYSMTIELCQEIFHSLDRNSAAPVQRREQCCSSIHAGDSRS